LAGELYFFADENTFGTLWCVSMFQMLLFLTDTYYTTSIPRSQVYHGLCVHDVINLYTFTA